MLVHPVRRGPRGRRVSRGRRAISCASSSERRPFLAMRARSWSQLYARSAPRTALLAPEGIETKGPTRGDNYFGALLDKKLRDPFADPACPSGDNGNFSVQRVHFNLPERCYVIGLSRIFPACSESDRGELCKHDGFGRHATSRRAVIIRSQITGGRCKNAAASLRLRAGQRRDRPGRPRTAAV
jgi:hypothetical protein